MSRVVLLGGCFCFVFAMVGCSKRAEISEAEKKKSEAIATLELLTDWSDQSLDPILAAFGKQTPIKILTKKMKSGKFTGKSSTADLVLAADATDLNTLVASDLLAPISESLTKRVYPGAHESKANWVGVTGHLEVLAYLPDRVGQPELPVNVFELATDKWRGRVGLAPSARTFSAFVAAMIDEHGAGAIGTWLRSISDNDVHRYQRDKDAMQALAAGKIDLALVDHSEALVWQPVAKKTNEPAGASDNLGSELGKTNLSVAIHVFADRKAGTAILCSAVAIGKQSADKGAAEKMVSFLLSDEGQAIATNQTLQIPLRRGARAPSMLAGLDINAALGPSPSEVSAIEVSKLLRITGLQP